MGRLATLERPSRHAGHAAAVTATSCAKCGGGKSAGACPSCEAEENTHAFASGRDLSGVPVHAGASAQSYDVGNGGDGETSTLATGSPETATQAVDGGTGEFCSPTGSFTNIPSGTLTPVHAGGNFNKHFQMEASFTAPIPCTCGLGVYRQYVRGYFKKDGTALTHRLLPGTTLDPTTFQEDGTPAGDAYGHRERAAVGGNQYLPDQTGGCTFQGRDTPGFRGVQSGHNYEINLDFRGELQDTSSSSVLATSSWSVVGTAAIP